MGFFNRHKLMLEDDNLLFIQWKEKKFLQQDTIQGIIENIEQDLGDTVPQKLSESLPYLTFQEAEVFFSEIRDRIEGNNAVEIGRVSVAHWEEGKKPSTDGEVYIDDLIIKPDFISIIKPLTEAIFNDKAFNDYEFGAKVSYFQDAIFPTYQQSTGRDADWLPTLPNENQASHGNVQLTIPHFATKPQPEPQVVLQPTPQVHQPANNTPSRPAVDAQPTVAAPAQYVASESTPPVVQTPPVARPVATQPTPQQMTQPSANAGSSLDDLAFGGGQPQETPANSQVQPGYNPQPQARVQPISPAPTPTRKERNAGNGGAALVQFPRFEIATFAKATYKPYEDEYVDWALNNQRKEHNHQLEEGEITNARLVEQSIQQQLRVFEDAELNKLGKKLAAADPRAGLKEQVIKEIKQKQSQVLKGQLKRLETERDQALAEEDQRYQTAKQRIHENFEQTKAETIATAQQQAIQTANSTYQERYYTATGELQKQLDTGRADIAKAKSAKEDLLAEKLAAVAHDIGTSDFQRRQEQLKRLRPQLKQENDYAKRVHLVERQEALRQGTAENANELVNQLQQELTASQRQRSESEARAQDLSQKLLDAHEKVIDVKSEHLKAASKPVVVDVPATPANSHVKKPSWMKRLIIGGVAVLLLAGGGTGLGLYVHGQTEAQTAQVTKLADRQQKLDKSLKAQKAASKKLQAKASSSSKKAQSDSTADKTQKALDSMSTDLRALLDRPVYVQSGTTTATTSSSSSSK